MRWPTCRELIRLMDVDSAAVVGQNHAPYCTFQVQKERILATVATQKTSRKIIRAVAQSGSAFDWGSKGRWFESSRPDYQGAFCLKKQDAPFSSVGSQRPPRRNRGRERDTFHSILVQQEG